MSIRGKAAAAALVCAAVVVGVILLWPAPDTALTSDQIKASAQARPDASLKQGRTSTTRGSSPCSLSPTPAA
ncbi:hypothetical protein [Streptomyces viridosporus]|uniref:hypothetical protein n=1 Tax=Streptomyces viridosporus TaxID=67581 RepID=UPI00117D4385|nr:hypothetical protein [Streptomyces viridosporus]